MLYYPVPGTTTFTIHSLAFCTLVKVERENIVQLKLNTSETTATGRRFKFNPIGRFTFDSTLPFAISERIFIIFKPPPI